MRSATSHIIVIHHLRCKLDSLLFQHGTDLLDIGRSLFLSINYVELTAATLLLRVDIIRFSGCRQSSTPMVKIGKIKLCRNGIAWSSIAKQLAGFGIPTVRITSLNHEIFDASMEKCAVVEAFTSKFEEVVTMQRCVIGKCDTNVAYICLDSNDVTLLFLLGLDRQQAHAKESEKNE